jgi:hypothetical protein
MADTDNSTSVPIVTIDGMPATGKTKLIDALKTHAVIKVKVIERDDPVLLSNYYSNPGKYAKDLHFSRLDTTVIAMKQAKVDATFKQYDLVILERSLHGNKAAFELDWQLGRIDEHHRDPYNEKFDTALREVGHPHYYFLLSDYDMRFISTRVEASYINSVHFNSNYFTQYLITQTRVFEDTRITSPIIHHFVLNVDTHQYYLNDTIKKIQSLARINQFY